MRQEIKDEALEQLELDIKFGFENEGELYDSIRDMFYNEEDFDEEWLRQTISKKYHQHQQDSSKWNRPTDFDRLAGAFDKLIMEKIVCLHNAGHTKQDGVDDCMETIEQLSEFGISTTGFCYYHSQDLARAVDNGIRKLFIGFGSTTGDDGEALQVGKRIVSILMENKFEVNWAGSVDQRIEIININWQKIPDTEDWRSGRVISLLTRQSSSKKPFWKFW